MRSTILFGTPATGSGRDVRIGDGMPRVNPCDRPDKGWDMPRVQRRSAL